MTEEAATRESRTETIRSWEEVPLYKMVPVRGPEGETLEAYRGVQRQDTKEIVSVMSPKYGLVQHADLVRALHTVGEALDKPESRTRGSRRAPASPGRASSSTRTAGGWR